jgi:hypothetical protein
MLFKEVIAVYSENLIEFINTKYTITEKPSGRHIYRTALRG